MIKKAPAFALALLIAAGLMRPWLVGAALAEEASTDLCTAVATRYQKLAEGPGASKDFYPDSPLSALADTAGTGITLAPHIAEVGKHLTPLQWTQAQKPPLTLIPRLKEELDRTDFLDHLPDSSYYAASRIEGTLSCYDSTFFTVADGKAEETKAPPNWSEEDGDSCGTYRVFGRVGTTPVAFEESFDYSGLLISTLSVSRWSGDHFAPGCSVTFHYGVRFSADQHFNAWDESCTAKNCGGLRQAALSLVQMLQADPAGTEATLVAKLNEEQHAAYEAMKADAHVTPPDKPDDPLYFSEKTPATLPLVLDGQLYLAEAGHQTIGWRSYSDWDVKFFERSAKDLGQVAEVAIGMAKGKLEKIEPK